MPSDLIHTIASNVWVVFLVILLFGGSIFVHELGHFLAARRRGVHVDRFSIGFGPAIWSWEGRDGVEYRISWIPLGGYVLLPQLADLSAIEGESRTSADRLPGVSYLTKMIVFAAGAAFNILFAFALACIVTIIGQPVSTGLSSTTVAEVMSTIKTADGKDVPSPAIKAGLHTGDKIVAVDGEKVATFSDMQERIALSSGWTQNGQRQTVLTVIRNGASLDIPVQPIISGPEKIRTVGFTTAAELTVARIQAGSPAEAAGLLADDELVAVNHKSSLSAQQLLDSLRPADTNAMTLTVKRGSRTMDLVVHPTKLTKDGADLGIFLRSGFIMTHPSPLRQVTECIQRTVRSLWAVINPRSDIGVSHLSGPLDIISNFVDVSRLGMPFALWFTILVNVNLAILNLLPVPVLDGGHMLFATIARLRGRALPTNFVMAAQSVFFVLIFAMIGYISIFVDIPRMVRENRAERAADAAAAAPSVPAPTAPSPVIAPAVPAPSK